MGVPATPRRPDGEASPIGIADNITRIEVAHGHRSIAPAEMADCTRRRCRKIGYLAPKLIQIIRSPSQTSRYYLPAMTNCHNDTGDRGS